MPRRPAIGIELLADPTRRRIIALVALRVRHPSQVPDAIGLSRPATSRQLRLLVDAGLLRWTWSMLDRRSRFYVIDPAMQAPIIAWLAGVDLGRIPVSFSPSWSRPIRQHRASADRSLADGGPTVDSCLNDDRSASLERSRQGRGGR
jgi:hypothetical protein